VEGFGWLLLALGFAQTDDPRARIAYVVAFVALVLSHAWR
jgi:hypothetical protein